jgi:hypothetical protein
MACDWIAKKAAQENKDQAETGEREETRRRISLPQSQTLLPRTLLRHQLIADKRELAPVGRP